MTIKIKNKANIGFQYFWNFMFENVSILFQVFSPLTARIVASHQIPITQQFPAEGWVEQDPMEILSVVRECINKTTEVLKEQDIEPSDIATVGVTNQRETTVVWDACTGQPLYNAIGLY